MRKLLGALAATALALTAAGLTTTASAATAAAAAAPHATVTTGSTSAATQRSATPILTGTHTLLSGGLALDVPGSSPNAGTQLDTSKAAGSANQNWELIPQSDGSYDLVNGSSGLCAEVNGGSTAAGAVVDQWPCVGSPNQFWTLTSLSNDSYIVSSVSSGLLLTTASTASGATVTQQVNSNSPQQQWTISSVNLALSGYHTLVTGGLALDDPGSSPNADTQLDTWPVAGSANQNWKSVQQSDGSYELVNGSSGLCADVTGGSTAAGAVVDQWQCVGSTNELWTLTPLPNGSYNVASVRSGLLLTAASTADGATVTQQVNSNSPQQQWTISSVNPVLSGYHTLVTGGLALDDPGSSPNAGIQLDAWTVAGSVNQNWRFVQQSDGSYELANGSSGLCAEGASVYGASTDAGGKVIQMSCNPYNSSEHWTLTPLSNGSYIVSFMDNGLLLTTASTASGTTMATEQVNTNSPQQQWTIS
ncbi:RICIN domain-containing protein [Kitasatospora sp. NBC_01266]|uniref:RICIN domain-containing protein n=1 Tax=Kitasatospora sp. NBC_01266 TaxID=2903572 RepID=UPI002E375CEF|nr:RICIN domain-containing protein [Kitasatospora sp. NBC_01266]